MTIELTTEQILTINKDSVKSVNHNYKNNPILDSPEKVVELLKHLKGLEQEHFVLVTLDVANRLIKKRVLTIGTAKSALVTPKEVLRNALLDNANGIIVAHNHPSGEVEASEADKHITNRLKKASEVIGIEFIDHIIIAGDKYRSI